LAFPLNLASERNFNLKVQQFVAARQCGLGSTIVTQQYSMDLSKSSAFCIKQKTKAT
jgi:hypothetical protein